MPNILLVEPDYRARFPPLGLLKIGTYHKHKGDTVRFVRGKLRDADTYWDRVYVASLFSFQHKRTIETILYYKKLLGGDLQRIHVGGIYASLFPDTIYEETGVFPHVGLLDKPGVLGSDKIIVDNLIPDYSLLDQVDYDYGLDDAYFGYATRGCPNTCKFCAVPTLEPTFNHYTGIRDYVEAIRKLFGEKQNLVLMDNNVLASDELERIITDIRDLGFERGAKLGRRKRYVDFNQGTDARLVNDGNAKLLASICVEPLRLAYDHVNDRRIFEKAIRTLHRHGLRKFSTYVLYNFHDAPSDLYTRLRHCVDLNEELGLQIYSFPMRYTPLDHKDRRHVGPKWTRREIRGLQCILNVAKGLVSHRRDLFLRAFGDSPEAFLSLVWMPDEYILNRAAHECNGAVEWHKTFRLLTDAQRDEFWNIVGTNDAATMQELFPRIRTKRVKHLVDTHIAHANFHPSKKS